MNHLIYEQWHFARPRLVATYLALLRDGPGDPIALQSPRRWGKTTFLQMEVMPAARALGFLPVTSMSGSTAMTCSLPSTTACRRPSTIWTCR